MSSNVLRRLFIISMSSRLYKTYRYLHTFSASPPTSVLAEFLSTSKKKYLEDVRAQSTPSKADEWTVVMGNEAGDLDSIASSIAYAYFQSHSNPSKPNPIIPLIQIAKDDLNLRGENIYALQLAGITSPEEQLLLLGDIPSSDFPSHQFALVDHNSLGSTFVSKDSVRPSRVLAIIDHHADEGLYTDTANPRVVQPAGSCASLITKQLFLPIAQDDQTQNQTLPKELATLLLSAILVDTDGLRPGGKAIDVDREAAAYLASIAVFNSSSSQSVSSQSLHETDSIRTLSQILLDRKQDVSHLSASELLRRDYKEYIYNVPWASQKPVSLKAGLSTVPVQIADWGLEGVLEREGESWMKERGLSVLGVLTSYRRSAKSKGKGKHEREMAWIIRTDSLEDDSIDWDTLEEKLWKGLRASEELEVKVHEEFGEGTANGERGKNLRVQVFMQNPKATRKVTAPVLKGIMESGT
ncbi:hypothetical protein D9758_005388 [Tetrapyrgos nigripes]|uniref:DHHA2 domain-containing protein n=1 Tax=Tetrapyrgos nigripes TaxID=182062 RepID=A0A8H5GI07_9AGAR|nr:hypothetical protein D9758_005388 [Tetrapyrgos nigripes]